MVLKFVFLFALASSVVARRAPNSDYVENLFKTNDGSSRYSSCIEEDSLLDVPGLISKYGYPIEVHDVTTSDGYILEVHRIPHGRDSNNTPDPKKPIVLVMHGLLSSSADFVVLGPGNALAYLLAEAGYDVWLANARGNFYSRRHLRLNPDSRLNQNFWKFSWDEIGNHDLPAIINRITALTGQDKLHYIGHSQGGTAFLVLNSLRPEYNAKFISFQGLAPASFFHYNNVSMFNSMAPYESIIETSANAMGVAEIFGSRDFVGWFTSNFCIERTVFSALCTSSIITGELSNSDAYNATMVPLFMAHAPAGAALRQVAHFGQVIRFGQFRRYNYNTFTNLANYGSIYPPSYNLARVTAPSYLHYGYSDNEVNYKDVLYLARQLPNVVGTFPAERTDFSHYDFIWGRDAKVMMYDKVIRFMKEAELRR